MNMTLGRSLIPINFAIVMVVAIVEISVFLLVTFKGPLWLVMLIRIAILAISLFCTLYLVITLSYIGKIVQAHQKTLRLWKNTPLAKYEKMVLKSVRPFSVDVGPFFKVGRMMGLSASMAIIKHTGKVVITFHK
jgi:hypothetical protein